MASQAPKIELALGNSGRVFKRWTRVGLNLRLDAIADGFTLQHVDSKGSAGLKQSNVIADSINEGERVRIKVDNKTVIDGYVDVVSLDLDFEQGPMVNVQGRSATADLIDCHGEYDTGVWKDTDFRTIAAQVCEPFAIDVVAGDGPAVDASKLAEINRRAALPFRRATLKPGETAADFLMRLAEERALTLTAYGDALALTIAGSSKIRGQLREGANIGAGGRRVADARDRFSHYRVIGQSAGDKAWHGDDARGGREASAEDENVGRYRPVIIVGEGTSSGGDYEDRAIWERNRRSARGRTAVAPILSWLDPAGDTWRANRLIDVDWPTMRIKGEMLIESVALDFDIDQGDTGSVALVHPGAYDPLKIPGSSGKQKPSGGAKTVEGFVKKVGNNWIERWSGDRPL